LAELNSLVASYQASFSEAVVERNEQIRAEEGPGIKDYKKVWKDTLDDPGDDSSVPF